MKVGVFNTDKKYNVIYADPPWEYKSSGSTTSSRGMAKQHYQTMSTEAICNLPVKKICTDETVCFLWATFPNIKEALKVMQAWEFTYKTAAFIWVKKNKKSNTNFWEMGAWTRANAEVCLMGIKKNSKASILVKSHSVHQIVEAPIRRHSEKPEEVRDRIVELLGNVPRIELFEREQSDGWDCWGDEI